MNNQPKHTPGPWTCNGKITTQAGRVVIEPDIAVVYIQESRYAAVQSKTRLANAALIAAAPDLLEALNDLTMFIDSTGIRDFDAIDTTAAHAAILKATPTEKENHATKD